MDLTVNEYEIVNNVILEISEQNKQNLTLNKIINGWEVFITQIEKGYVDSIYDYTNDLSLRNIISKVINNLPREIQKKLILRIKILDDKFISVTQEIDQPLGRGYNKQKEFWWFRIPKNVGGELEEDLKSQGYIS